jgi:hypothetical protein
MISIRRLSAAAVLLLVPALPAFAQDKKPEEKKAEKKKPAPIESFIDAAAAGKEYALQGEYEDPIQKVAAQVVALGDATFDVYFLRGGLPGAGWDGKTRVKAPARINIAEMVADPPVRASGSGWTATLREGSLHGSDPDGKAFVMKKVERKSPTLGEKPPPGAVVLFDGSGADEWINGKVVDGLLLMGVNSRKTFGDCRLHIEFRLSFMPKARGQGRANSGVYLQGRYEVQVLDSFGLSGENNECGGIYGKHKPLVNMCLPPLAWQTYDVDFTAARFDDAGKKTADARMTVRHNGVVIHDNAAINSGTTAAPNKEGPAPGFLHLQNHGNPIHFRNIWVVEKKP